MVGERRQRAWLAIVAGDAREHAGNDGYDDDPAQHYSWDSTVPNSSNVKAGDALVLWDKRELLGASLVERVDVWDDMKALHQCPNCGSAGFKKRKTQTPAFRCPDCREEFEQPESRVEPIKAYRSVHGPGWTSLRGVLDKAELRSLCFSPRSQLSIRGMDWSKLISALDDAKVDAGQLTHLNLREDAARGHAIRSVRSRLGQAAFRKKLLDRFDAICAFSGANPESVLEAAHLYSYAQVGVHHDHGGLLMRRDLHSLFDAGLLAVSHSSLTVDLAEELLGYASYAHLQGVTLSVELSDLETDWLRRHWDQHRG